MQEQLFSETEVGELVRRASELQDSGSTTGYVPGLTRSELAKMALEAGIDPAYLDQAIRERAEYSTESKKLKWSEVIVRVLPVEISPEDFELVTEKVNILPAQTTQSGTSGGLAQVGRSIHGKLRAGWVNPAFKVTSRGGRTRMEVSSNNEIAIAITTMWAILFPLLPIALAVKLGPLAGIAGSLLCLGGAVWTFRALMKKAQAATRIAAKALEDAVMQVGTPTSELEG